ncbi:MAG: aminotransferase class I/II-fold pyridoxal phosphate-dependent enzyme [Deltaproteobacteria bacterium]|nr:aminotransferase class I/II-fold pyridoxal phosphate-dependent enzyme [Deltaproteobacteria bacterium]
MDRIPQSRTRFNEKDYTSMKSFLDGYNTGHIKSLEKSLGDFHGVKHVVAVSSGTSALYVLFQALNLSTEDAVIVPSYTWPSAANAAALLGARVIFADVDPDSYLVTPEILDELLGKKRSDVRRMYVVQIHQFGLVEHLRPISEICIKHDSILLEDSAWSLGSDQPLSGIAGIWSFHPRKLISGGEGGAVYTDNDELAEKCRIYRNHGYEQHVGFSHKGLNLRLPEVQAVLINNQMERVVTLLQSRLDVAEYYFNALGDIPEIKLPVKSKEHLYQAFTVFLNGINKNDFISKCDDSGVEIKSAGFCTHTHKAWSFEGHELLDVSLSLENSLITLPTFEGISETQLKKVVETVKENL